MKGVGLGPGGPAYTGWVRDLGPFLGYFSGRLRRECCYRSGLRATVRSGRGPALRERRGRRVLTAEQERRFGDFGEGHGTTSWD